VAVIRGAALEPPEPPELPPPQLIAQTVRAKMREEEPIEEALRNAIHILREPALS
jgi:hypothetical protein